MAPPWAMENFKEDGRSSLGLSPFRQVMLWGIMGLTYKLIDLSLAVDDADNGQDCAVCHCQAFMCEGGDVS